MSQPRVIENGIIKTYDGKVEFYNDTRSLIGSWVGNYKGNLLFYDDKKGNYIIAPKDDNLASFVVMSDRSIDSVSIMVDSSMNLTHTIDFLNTLKIEKIRKGIAAH